MSLRSRHCVGICDSSRAIDIGLLSYFVMPMQDRLQRRQRRRSVSKDLCVTASIDSDELPLCRAARAAARSNVRRRRPLVRSIDRRSPSTLPTSSGGDAPDQWMLLHPRLWSRRSCRATHDLPNVRLRDGATPHASCGVATLRHRCLCAESGEQSHALQVLWTQSPLRGKAQLWMELQEFRGGGRVPMGSKGGRFCHGIGLAFVF